MRIGTYNVLGLRGYPREEAAGAIGKPGEDSNGAHFARVFAQLNCDILGLQEGVASALMQTIARAMERHLATIPSPLSCPGHVLSRYPVIESRTFSHMVPDEHPPPYSRTCGAALLAIDDDTTLWVVGIHLHPHDEDLRVQESDLLRDRIEAIRSVTGNIIVLGDFNSGPDFRVHQNLKALDFVNAMETAGGGVRATTDTVGVEKRCLDHIYASPSLAPRLKNATVVRDSGFRHDGPQEEGVFVHSDHLPVIAQFEWP